MATSAPKSVSEGYHTPSSSCLPTPEKENSGANLGAPSPMRITHIEAAALEQFRSPDAKARYLLIEASSYNSKGNHVRALKTTEYALKHFPTANTKIRNDLFRQKARAHQGLQQPTAALAARAHIIQLDP